jgi:hypothetical protein
VISHLKAKNNKCNFSCYHAYIGLIMSQQTQSDIFHTKILQNALWCQITWSKCMLCTILDYHIFCCNMFVFACPIIAKSQCWLFAIRICPHISVFAPEFNFRYLRSGLKVQGKMMHTDMHKI